MEHSLTGVLEVERARDRRQEYISAPPHNRCDCACSYFRAPEVHGSHAQLMGPAEAISSGGCCGQEAS